MFNELTLKPYKVWIDEATQEECDYWKNYFLQYPNKGNYETMYNNALRKHACILDTDWEYETESTYYTIEEFLEAYREYKTSNDEYERSIA